MLWVHIQERYSFLPSRQRRKIDRPLTNGRPNLKGHISVKKDVKPEIPNFAGCENDDLD